MGELAKGSYTEAVLEKRKTIQTKDIGKFFSPCKGIRVISLCLDKAIASKAMFDFLEDTLCDWPDAEMSRAPTQEEEAVPESSDKMLASVEEETEDDGDDEVEICLLCIQSSSLLLHKTVVRLSHQERILPSRSCGVFIELVYVSFCGRFRQFLFFISSSTS